MSTFGLREVSQWTGETKIASAEFLAAADQRLCHCKEKCCSVDLVHFIHHDDGAVSIELLIIFYIDILDNLYENVETTQDV